MKISREKLDKFMTNQIKNMIEQFAAVEKDLAAAELRAKNKWRANGLPALKLYRDRLNHLLDKADSDKTIITPDELPALTLYVPHVYGSPTQYSDLTRELHNLRDKINIYTTVRNYLATIDDSKKKISEDDLYAIFEQLDLPAAEVTELFTTPEPRRLNISDPCMDDYEN